MAHPPDANDMRRRMERIETLVAEIEQFPDATARSHTREIVQALMDLHGTGLKKVLDHIMASGATGQSLIDALARDDLVGGLLLLYGLHPLDIDTRVRQALAQVNPTGHALGGDVELRSVVEGVVRLRLVKGDPAAAGALQRALEDAIFEKAPDVTAIQLEEPLLLEETAAGRGRFSLPLVAR